MQLNDCNTVCCYLACRYHLSLMHFSSTMFSFHSVLLEHVAIVYIPFHLCDLLARHLLISESPLRPCHHYKWVHLKWQFSRSFLSLMYIRMTLIQYHYWQLNFHEVVCVSLGRRMILKYIYLPRDVHYLKFLLK